MEQFFTDNSTYIVLFIVLIIWAGIAGFLFLLENKINKLEKRISLKLDSDE